MEKLSFTEIGNYLREVPAVILVAIISVLGLILFLPQEIATVLAVDEFRDKYRVFLGPTFLLIASFLIARLFMLLKNSQKIKRNVKVRQKMLHTLTPEEKGYLVLYIRDQKNSIEVGLEDGVMSGLERKEITYRASDIGDSLNGFAYNLQPWAREYLQENPHFLTGYTGSPMTPRQKLHAEYYG